MTRIRTLAILLALTLVTSAADLAPTAARAAADTSRIGGACAYANYTGRALIGAVTPLPPQKTATHGAKAPSPGYDVTFTFIPDSPITGEPLYTPGRTHTLTLANGTPPGQKFLEKYGIAPGQTFICQVRIIRRGTCTPVLFTFPGIDLADYFELQKP